MDPYSLPNEFEVPELGKVNVHRVDAAMLNNLTVKLFVVQDGGVNFVFGMDMNSGLIYLIAEK